MPIHSVVHGLAINLRWVGLREAVAINVQLKEARFVFDGSRFDWRHIRGELRNSLLRPESSSGRMAASARPEQTRKRNRDLLTPRSLKSCCVTVILKFGREHRKLN